MAITPVSATVGCAPGPGSHAAASTQLGALNDQIRRDKQQLNDWVTCVSAKTTKGHAEIQRLSADLAGARTRADRLATSPANAPSTSATHLVDVWA